jgi:hypothetical protein
MDLCVRKRFIEIELGTDPADFDTDGDGIFDGDEDECDDYCFDAWHQCEAACEAECPECNEQQNACLVACSSA